MTCLTRRGAVVTSSPIRTVKTEDLANKATFDDALVLLDVSFCEKLVDNCGGFSKGEDFFR